MSASDKTGGGLIGGAVCSLLYNLFDFGGTLVILILIAIISGIIISEKTFLRAMARALDSFTYKFKFKGSSSEIEEEVLDYDEENDYNETYEDVAVVEEKKNNPKPRNRRAKTFNIFKIFNEAKDEEQLEQNDSDEDVGDFNDESDNDESEEDFDVENKDIDNDEIDDSYDEYVSGSTGVFETEMNNKFASTSEYDIRNLADRLINGNLEDKESIDFDADNLTFEQFNNADFTLDTEMGTLKCSLTLQQCKNICENLNV